jgi:hypothetical protein
MRRIVKISVLFALIYFVVGFIIAKLNLLPCFTYQIYLEFSSIVGGLSSAFGLLALGIPVLTTKDLERLELESLRNLANLTEATKKYSSEIDQLEQKKKRMEYLIWKACITISFKERHSRNIDQLKRTYSENVDIEKRLRALNEEIEKNGDKELFDEIIMYIKEQTGYEGDSPAEELKGDGPAEALSSIFWIKPTLFGIGIDMNELFKMLLRSSKRRLNKK